MPLAQCRSSITVLQYNPTICFHLPIPNINHKFNFEKKKKKTEVITVKLTFPFEDVCSVLSHFKQTAPFNSLFPVGPQEWINQSVGSEGCYAAVGSIDHSIQLWHLEEADPLEPAQVLGVTAQ